MTSHTLGRRVLGLSAAVMIAFAAGAASAADFTMKIGLATFKDVDPGQQCPKFK